MSGLERCRFCGKKGHGAKPSFAQKKELCPAFDKKCNSCGDIGHFSRTKACKKSVKVEKLMVQHETRVRKQVGVKTVRAVQNSEGKPVRLSVTKPIPHMLEVDGRMVIAMPRAHPGIRVQREGSG